MARLIRKCTHCGALDDRRSWASLDDASKQGAFEEPWTCAGCAWSEFQLEEADTEIARA